MCLRYDRSPLCFYLVEVAPLALSRCVVEIFEFRILNYFGVVGGCVGWLLACVFLLWRQRLRNSLFVLPVYHMLYGTDASLWDPTYVSMVALRSRRLCAFYAPERSTVFLLHLPLCALCAPAGSYAVTLRSHTVLCSLPQGPRCLLRYRSSVPLLRDVVRG
jgi:hypothetical protein